MPADVVVMELNRDKEHRYESLWADLSRMSVHRVTVRYSLSVPMQRQTSA